MTGSKEKLFKYFRHNFAAYAEHLLHVKAGRTTGEIVPFKLNRIQRYLWALLQEDLRAGRPIRWMILKSRQFGGSTFLVGIMFWLITMNANKSGLVVGHKKEASSNLLNMAQLFYQMLPEWAKFRRKNNNRNELYFANPDDQSSDLGLRSRMRIETADDMNLAASTTLDYAIFTEVPRYAGLGLDVRTMMTSFNQTVPFRAGTAIFWEGTAQGREYFYERWMDEDNVYRKIFISYVPIEEYSLPFTEFFRLSEIPDSKYGDEQREAELIKEEIKKWYPDIVDPERINVKVYEKLAWRRHAIDNLCEGSKEFFRQEYPISVEDAFMLSGNSVFETTILADRRALLRTRDNKKDLIPFDKVRFVRGSYNVERPDWWREAFQVSEYGKLKVFEPPMEHSRYIVCADPTQGQDSSSDEAGAHVLRLPDMVQVASYHEIINNYEFADFLYALSKHYYDALLIVESNGPGSATVNRLNYDLHYPNLYRRRTWDGIVKKYVEKFGWNTGSEGGLNKSMMIGELAAHVRLTRIMINDCDTIDEMMSYRRLDNGKLGGEKGRPDNLVTSLAIGIMAAKEIGNYQFQEVRKIKPWSLEWAEGKLVGHVNNGRPDYNIGRIG